jgi:DUF4097 and DUF4098 domain-containing protein YvlB
MKGRSIAILLISAALVATLGLCGLTTFGTYRWVKNSNLDLVQNNTVSAEVHETQTFLVSSPAELEVETSLGDIQVIPGTDNQQIVVEAVKKGWGENQAAAEADAQAVPVEMSQDGSKLTVKYQAAAGRSRLVLFGQERPGSVDFVITVPAQTAVTLKTGAGSLTLRGTQGDAALEAAFGDVTVEDLLGGLKVTGNSGSLTIQRVTAGDKDITLSTSFGETLLEDSTGKSIRVQNSSGGAGLHGVKASGDLWVQNSFSKVEMKDVRAANLSVDCENGEVQIEKGSIGGELKLNGSFGGMQVSGVDAARYTLHNQNGEILLDGARGSLDLSTSFGGVQVTGAKDAVLKIKVENGKADFSGSLEAAAQHSLETSFGDITLALPAATALTLDLEATFGKIHSDLPVLLSGEMSDTRWQASLNGGGTPLTAKAENGSIRLVELK